MYRLSRGSLFFVLPFYIQYTVVLLHIQYDHTFNAHCCTFYQAFSSPKSTTTALKSFSVLRSGHQKFRECVRTGAVGAQTCRSLGYHLLHPLILRLLVLFAPTVQRYTYRVIQTIQMKLIILRIRAEPAVLGSTETALKFKYDI